MRFILLVALLLLPAPALAQFWSHYSNDLFRYEIDIPPGFEGNGETAGGEGQWFYNLEAEQGLTIWGARFPGSFERSIIDGAAAIRSEGWAITEQSSTPEWATLAAMRDHRLIFQRSILLCDRKSYAAFRAEFNIRDLGKMGDILGGLSRSFVPKGC
ncbi:MAG: hypothetical protein GX970_15510 [Phyllobacteriaceae bacterium]|nr:hypothetical protein [Phyllobacteriaceae bacterium]